MNHAKPQYIEDFLIWCNCNFCGYFHNLFPLNVQAQSFLALFFWGFFKKENNSMNVEYCSSRSTHWCSPSLSMSPSESHKVIALVQRSRIKFPVVSFAVFTLVHFSTTFLAWILAFKNYRSVSEPQSKICLRYHVQSAVCAVHDGYLHAQ